MGGAASKTPAAPAPAADSGHCHCHCQPAAPAPAPQPIIVPAPAAAPIYVPVPVPSGPALSNSQQWRKITLMVGPPGAGKGTQSHRASLQWRVPHISTGDILRKAVKDNTELGKKAKSFMDKGELVPDDLMMKLVRDRIKGRDCGWGFILDGYPRTLAQAQAFDALLAEHHEHVTKVIHLDMPDEKLITRNTGRWVHPASGRSYNAKYMKPKSLIAAGPDAKPTPDNMKCNHTGEPLVQRSDDNEAAVKTRLAIYHRDTQPVINHYKAQGNLVTINGDMEVDRVFALVTKSRTKQFRKIILLDGAPGSGKGHQATRLSRAYNLQHISTGDMLRDAVNKGTDLGKRCKSFMDQGQLVPDELIINVLKERIKEPDCGWGFILDGFPRNLTQSKALTKILLDRRNERVSKVIHLEVPDDVLVARNTGRWIHKASGRTYNVSTLRPQSLRAAGPNAKPGPDNMKDDHTGEPLIQRSDDTEAIVKVRLATYHKETEPVFQYFKTLDRFYSINGNQSPDHVFDEISKLFH